MAFINSFTPKLSLTSSSFRSSVDTRRPTPALRATPTMKVDIAEKVRQTNASFTSIEESRLAKERAAFDTRPGFSEFSETLNGRLAMLGFVIGLVTEIVTGKGINEQLVILFSPITHLFH